MKARMIQPRLPEGYKLTDVGLIPEDWSVSALRPCLRSSPRYGINAAAVALDDNLPTYLRITDISDDGHFVPSPPVSVRHRDAPAYFLSDGDIVFARTGASVGKSYLYRPDDGALVFAGFLIQISPDPSTLDPVFLAHYVHSKRYWDWVATVSIRSGQPGINGREYATFQVPLPDIKEQRAIVEALSDVGALIGALEKLIAKQRAIKLAAMQQLLTGKSRLPGFTDKWEKKRLGDHVRYLTHGVNSRAELSTEGPVRYLHYGDVHAAATPWLLPESGPMPRLPVQKCAGLDRLESGDLVLVDASEDLVGVGKSVELRNVNGIEVVAGLHTIAARFDKEIFVDGFKGYLQYIPAFKSHLEKLAAGTKVYATNRSHVSSAELPLPSIQEQSAIVAVLADIDAEIKTFERRRDKTKQIKQGMMQSLLTGRIRLVTPQAPSAQDGSTPKDGTTHSWAFNEAVVISKLANQFGSEQFPLGRKRYTKLSYLLHRHAEKKAEGYLKKAAGPYNPRTKYAGPERIAVENGYVREHKSGPYSGFVAADKITQAETYFEKWYGPDCMQWLEQFRYKKNDDLELLATVDMAAMELRAAGKDVSVTTVKGAIRSHPEWQGKLNRPIFSDTNINAAIESSRKLFG